MEGYDIFMGKQLNSKGNLTTTIIFPNGNKVELLNYKENKILNYKERLEEVEIKVLSNPSFISCCEKYWLGVTLKSRASEKVKSCLDVLATYLLRASDSGIEDVVIY